MAIVIGNDAVVIYGLSTDVKPVKPVGSIFIETDTEDEFSVDEAGVWFNRKKPSIVTTNDGKKANVTVQASLPDRQMKDVNANGSTYYGTAPYGSALSDPVWVIERDTNGNYVTSAPNQIWNNRVTVPYNNGVA